MAYWSTRFLLVLIQNGRIEQAHLTILDAVRTLLDTSLPITLWAEAASYSVHVRNRVLMQEPDESLTLSGLTVKSTINISVPLAVTSMSVITLRPISLNPGSRRVS
jgi:hypothetical protein